MCLFIFTLVRVFILGRTSGWIDLWPGAPYNYVMTDMEGNSTSSRFSFFRFFGNNNPSKQREISGVTKSSGLDDANAAKERFVRRTRSLCDGRAGVSVVGGFSAANGTGVNGAVSGDQSRNSSRGFQRILSVNQSQRLPPATGITSMSNKDAGKRRSVTRTVSVSFKFVLKIRNIGIFSFG